jgi:hypothetical protein
MPDFLLCNSKLTFQLTMTPEKTNYITQGVDGQKRLKQGPDLASYRGLSVIHSRAFSLETGQEPRDILRRRVRTAEYYRILPHRNNRKREFELYNEARDTWFALTFQDLVSFARLEAAVPGGGTAARLGRNTAADPWGSSRGQPMQILGAMDEASIVSAVDKVKAAVKKVHRRPLMDLFMHSIDGKNNILFKSTSADNKPVHWDVWPYAGIMGVKLERPRHV